MRAFSLRKKKMHQGGQGKQIVGLKRLNTNLFIKNVPLCLGQKARCAEDVGAFGLLFCLPPTPTGEVSVRRNSLSGFGG